jgi:hypothetical protein
MRGLPLARAKVRARVAQFMTTPLTIKRGQLGAFDPATGLVGGLASAATVYTGNGRIHSITGQGGVVAGDGEFDTRQVIISIPWNAAEPARDDLVIVTSDAADPDLAHSVYRVMEVNGGSLFNDSTQLSCVGWHPSRHWGEQ